MRWKVHGSVCLLALAVGCSAGSGRVLRDGGAAPPDAAALDSGPVGAVDGGAGRDASGGSMVDAGPAIDAGCEATTPLETAIIGDPPDILLVVDISGSMCTPLIDMLPPSTISKLAVMKEALNRLVGDFDRRVNFGLMLFPQAGECGPGAVLDPIAPRNAGAIQSTLGALADDLFGCALANTGATPTHTSLDAARSYYGTVAVNPVGRYVLLATDGLPNCGPENSEGELTETVDETVTAIEGLQGDDIDTYVIGFGADLSGGEDALRRMAMAGGTGSPFNARTPTELEAALDAIAAEVIPPSCTVEVAGPERDPRLFRVSFDGGEPIPRNTSRTSGWDYDAATRTITFYGDDCTRVQDGTVSSVDVEFGCPGPLI